MVVKVATLAFRRTLAVWEDHIERKQLVLHLTLVREPRTNFPTRRWESDPVEAVHKFR